MRILVVGARWFLDDITDERRSDFQRLIKLSGGNTGNLFIGEAARYHILRHFPGAELERVTNWQIQHGPKVNPDWARENFDFIVMAAANMLNERINMPVLAKFVEESGLPVIIFGVGAQAEDTEQTIKVPNGTLRLLKVASERSSSIGARGPYSVKVLNDNGIGNAEVSGCPSMYFRTGQNHRIENPDPAQVKRVSMFAKWDNLRYDIHTSLKAFQAAQMRLAMRDGYDYIVQADFLEAKAGFGDTFDRQAVRNRARSLGIGDRDGEALTAYFQEHARVFFDYAAWRDHLKNTDFTFGARFHGNMMSVMHGVPGLFVCHDTRTIEMCEHMHMPYITPKDLNADDLSLEALIERADFTDFNRHYEAKCAAFDTFLNKQFAPFKAA